MSMVSVSEVHSLEGQCISGCNASLTYQWYLKVLSETGYYVQIDESVLLTMVTTPLSSFFYSARANAYQGDTWYMLFFRAYRSEHVFGETSMKFFVNNAPENGFCSIAPKVGTFMVDFFNLSCHGWQDLHSPLSYRFYTKMDNVLSEIYQGWLSNVSKQLALKTGGDMSDSENMEQTIYFEIIDGVGARTIVNDTVQVNLPPDIDSVVNEVSDTLTGENSPLDVLSQSGDYLELSRQVQIYGSLFNAPRDKDQNNDTQKGARVQLRSLLYDKVSSIKMKSTKDINLIAGPCGEVLQNPDEISDNTRKKVQSKVDEMLGVLESDEQAPRSVVLGALPGVLSMTNKVAESAANLVSVEREVDGKVDEVVKKQNLDNSRRQVKNARQQMNKTSEILKHYSTPGAGTIVIETKDQALGLAKILSNEKEASSMAGGVGLTFNPGLYRSEQSEDDNDFVTVKVLKFANLYSFDQSSLRVNSAVTGINFENSQTNGPMEVKDASEPLKIIIENREPKQSSFANNSSENSNSTGDGLTANVFRMEVGDNGEQWSFHAVDIHNESFRAVINPQNTSLRLTVYMRENNRPSPDKYLFRWIVPDSSSCDWLNRTGFVNRTVDVLRDQPEDYSCRLHPFSVFISDELELDGKFILGVHYLPSMQQEEKQQNTSPAKKRRRRRNTPSKDSDDSIIDLDLVDDEFCVTIKPPPPTPAPTLPPGEFVTSIPVITNDSVTYNLTITKAKCLFWDEMNETWSSNGCFVDAETTPERTVCLCTHLTDFGGDVMVAPNPIDMNAVFAGLNNLGDNLGVLMVIISLFLIYIILGVWVSKKDRKDEIERQMVHVDCTNGRPIKQTLIITVITGAGNGSGTTARVYGLLRGSKGEMVIPLNTSENTLFKTRSTVILKITLSREIGEVDFFRVFHDNGGRSPSWYLRSILVVDTETRNEFPFVCDTWLSVESVDGQIDRTLVVATEKDLKSFHLIFASKVSKGLLDGHIWFSIFLRPAQSSFTRFRRLTACLALIFLTMLTNAMFFGASDAPGGRKIVYLGNFKVNLTGVMIGIQSSIIIIPPSVIIVEIFRRLKPKKKQKVKEMEVVEIAGDESYLDKEENEDEMNNSMVFLKNDQNTKKKEKKKESKPFMLPHGFKYVAYFVVFASVSSSATVCFFYSMMWGPRRSNEWLVSMFTGFFQSVIVIQPVKAVFVAVLFAAILRKPVKHDVTLLDDDDKIEEERNEQ
eukprot:TCONS_00011552-protein